jgi:poly(A) polymerase
MAVHPTGIEHGTVTVVHRGAVFEVTTLRRDVETFGRHATVAFTDDWAEDAERRDFTMNALYADASGKIHDPANGYADILKRRVRFVGDPRARIREDYLRILRFFRFHARYGGVRPDAAGLAACVSLRKGLSTLSPERIRQELMKLLAARGAVATLKVMARTGVLRHILPHTEEWRALARLPADPLLRLAVLAIDPAGLQERLRLSNDEAKRLRLLVQAPAVSPSLRGAEQRRMLYDLGPPVFADAVHLALARARAPLTDRAWRRLLALPQRWTAPTFPVNGADLKSIGLAPGPAMGETLRRLEDWWVASDFKPTREDLLARAK